MKITGTKVTSVQIISMVGSLVMAQVSLFS